MKHILVGFFTFWIVVYLSVNIAHLIGAGANEIGIVVCAISILCAIIVVCTLIIVDTIKCHANKK